LSASDRQTSAATIEACARRLSSQRPSHLVVVTGAGISLASGIDPGAVWKHDVTELGTRRYFERDPVGSWRWYSSRFDLVLDKQPNPAHTSLRALEDWQIRQGGEFLLVTQNIDGLHRLAGSERLVEVHGNAHYVRCSQPGCANAAPRGMLPRRDVDIDKFLDSPAHDTLPRCDVCQGLLRQHVLWFDEYYDEHESYQWPKVQSAAVTMDFTLFVGTSFSVGVTDLFAQMGMQRGISMYSIDPNHDSLPYRDITPIKASAEICLPQLMRLLEDSS
jgi:NAD-dependent deacetylase